MYCRLLKPPQNKSFFLFGPRGTGKTTWVRNAFPRAVYLDLLEAELFNDLLANPQRLERLIPRGFRDWIIIDEIQKIPGLLDEVHRLIESGRHRFILTGSSARKLRRGGPNLLAGRALTYSFHPLTAAELGQAFRLDHSLAFGHLPSAYTEENPSAYLESYVRTYLQEEVREEGLTRNLGAFARFLEAASFSQGSLLNVSSVARECGVERKVVENYFSILEDMLIAYRVPAFARRSRRRLAVHDKFYFFDVGVYRTLRPRGPLDMPEEIEGAAIETLFLQELVALNALCDRRYKIHYWRTATGMEVDFVLYGPRGLLAFEVKRTRRPTQEALRGLKAFAADYPMARAFLIYGGERELNESGIRVLSFENALRELPDLLS
jgi:predicted AAA+ superfamily ATPase